MTMKPLTIALLVSAVVPQPTWAACDDLVDAILANHLAPALADSGCPLPGLDKGAHKLNRVCYESAGATSHITIDTTLTCQASAESVPAKLLGGKNTPSKSENVTVEADARGADCSLTDVKVKPSGELAKVAASRGAKARGEASDPSSGSPGRMRTGGSRAESRGRSSVRPGISAARE